MKSNLQIKCGNDVVLDERIENKLNDKKFLTKIFHPSELSSLTPKKLAGIFSLKESVFKALEISSKNWLEVEIGYKKNGKPVVLLSNSIKPLRLMSIDCSVSHESGFTYSMVVILLHNE